MGRNTAQPGDFLRARFESDVLVVGSRNAGDREQSLAILRVQFKRGLWEEEDISGFERGSQTLAADR